MEGGGVKTRGDVKTALQLLREAAVCREFQRAPGHPTLYECIICFAVVAERSRLSHLDWHDEVHANLVELQRLLESELQTQE